MQPAERIVIKGDQVGVERKRKPLWRCALSEIVRIDANKRDQGAVDLICFDIWYETDGEWMVTAHEDLEGWEELTACPCVTRRVSTPTGSPRSPSRHSPNAGPSCM
jgi:hypothetical protein